MPRIDESTYREHGLGIDQMPDPSAMVQTRLHFAAAGGDAEECARLLSLPHTRPNAVDEFGFTPLHDAAYSGACSSINALLADPRVDRFAKTANDVDSTPLHLAVEEGHLDAVKILATLASCAIFDAYGRSAFFLATEAEYNPIALHLAPLCSPRLANPKGFTPLLCAAQHGSPECMALLLAASDIHAKTTDGNNAAWLAARSGNPKALELAIASGIDFHAANRHGSTPAMAASTLESPECLALLIARGADIHARDPSGRTLAIIAADFTRHACLAILLEHGADPLAKDISGHDARHYAGFNTYSDCLEVLDSFASRSEIEASTPTSKTLGHRPPRRV